MAFNICNNFSFFKVRSYDAITTGKGISLSPMSGASGARTGMNRATSDCLQYGVRKRESPFRAAAVAGPVTHERGACIKHLLTLNNYIGGKM